MSTPAPAIAVAPTFAAFLTGTPVLVEREIQVRFVLRSGYTPHIQVPVLRLHCETILCGGERFFDPSQTTQMLSAHNPEAKYDFLFDYACRNCRRSPKTYALRMMFPTVTATAAATAIKIGEIPAFGEPRPNVVRDVLDDEIEMFDRGYRAETAGLGIGAFAYYRRFVESHKDKIIGAIRDVAIAQSAKSEVIAALDRALATNSFDRAVEAIKDAIPESLKYQGGHNPLTLLHANISGGLHKDDDVACLEIAKDIRLLLTDLAERTTQALKNQGEINEAVKRMFARAKPQSTK